MRLTPKIHRAIITASRLHDTKRRKGDGSPYITHPFAVAVILSDYTDDEDIIAAALLHDILEDVPSAIYGAEQMRNDFGERVYEIVMGVSEDRELRESTRSKRETWKERKDKYLANLNSAGKEQLLVCCADKIHNLISLIDAHMVQGEGIWQKFNASKQEMMWFFHEVLLILKRRLRSPIANELELAYNKAMEKLG